MPNKYIPRDYVNPNHSICSHCNGYGSSLQDPIGVDTCTVCHGTGIVTSTTERSEGVNNQKKTKLCKLDRGICSKQYGLSVYTGCASSLECKDSYMLVIPSPLGD